MIKILFGVAVAMCALPVNAATKSPKYGTNTIRIHFHHPIWPRLTQLKLHQT